MFQVIQSLCDQYFGWIDWDAVSGLGSALALIWAIALTFQQSADLRRREAALVKAILVTVDLSYSTVEMLDERLRWSVAYLTETLTPEEYSRRRAETRKLGLGFMADTVETTFKRLEEIKVTDVPSSALITDVLSIIIRLKNISEGIMLMVEDRHNVVKLQSECGYFLMTSRSLAATAHRIGVKSSLSDAPWMRAQTRVTTARNLSLVIANPVLKLWQRLFSARSA